MMENVNDLELWKRKRSKTFTAFCFVGVLLGLEYGIVPPTLFTYLKDGINTKKAQIWFGVITSSYFFSSMVGCLTITRYTDRTRNIKKTLIIVCFLVTLGNFIYAIPSYAVVLLLGRLLQGIAHSLISVLQGEIIRNYEEEERVQKLSTFTISTYVCYIGSPIVITIFRGIDFEILGVRFAVYNFPFIFVGVLWALSILLTIFFVSDLSKEHHLQVGKTKDENPSNKELPLTTLLSNYQFSFILLLT